MKSSYNLANTRCPNEKSAAPIQAPPQLRRPSWWTGRV